ncbi:hypothetical protein CYMTET_35769 [Cymbomonas tetramitiformis]|uniref:C3H1-type domain-containing protein n=1 Tax=Cymbomonas tetramitiformis TaxID=36881 RepID=A0AAE0KNU3_9CHLO|nr:hypothetical protein CYMTET_35769 [Cymbomonas tetramitiformis]
MANGARSEEVMKSVYQDVKMVARMMESGITATRRCAGAAAAVDRVVQWAKAAKLRSAIEMFKFALAGGEFTPAELEEDGEIITPATLVPPARGGPAFCAEILKAAEQCAGALTGELGFKVPDAPQLSLSGARGNDRREAESEAGGDDEEPAEEDLFEEAEEEPEKTRQLKKAKHDAKQPSPADLAADEALKRRVDAWLGARVGAYEPVKGAVSGFALRERPSAKLRRKVVADPVTGEMKSVAVPRLSKDQFLEQNFEMMEKITDEKERALFRKYVSWILTLAERYAWADVYDFDAQVRDDFEQGKVTSWDPVPLAFKFQYTYTETLGDAQRRLTDDNRGNGNRGNNPKAPGKRNDGKDGLCDFFQLAKGCKKGKDCKFVHSCRKCKGADHASLIPEEKATGMRTEAKARRPERKWSARFLAMFTAVGVSLASYGVPEADWSRYKQDVEAVGARVSPLTERVDRWAQAAWGLPGAEEVVRGVATGFRWQQEQPAEFFEVENYVPARAPGQGAEEAARGGGSREDGTLE